MERLSSNLIERVVQYTNHIFPQDNDLLQEKYEELLDYVIRKDHRGQLRVLLDIKPCTDSKLVVSVVCKGAADCLDLLITTGFIIQKETLLLAACAGNVRCLQLLFNTGLKPDGETALAAAAAGQIDCIQLLLSVGCPIPENITSIAIQFGQPECAQYLRDAGY